MLNIALDGPAGAGKSTVAKALAEKLDILYLDTGAMYRATALYMLRRGVAVSDEKGVEEALPSLPLSVRYDGGKQRTMLGEEDVSSLIRTPELSMAASDVSKIPAVRIKMVEMQREIAHGMDCVLDGRDIGTFVLPDCKNKFFITAKPETRAARRYIELREKGVVVDEKEVLSDIRRRDENDRNRDFAPLKQAKDAVVVDTSDMTIEEVVAAVLSRVGR